MTAPPKSLCMGPWTHAHLSTQMQRKLCCIAKPLPAESTLTISEFWNGEYMRSVRRRMLNGETLSECQVCNSSELGLQTYKEWFNTRYSGLLDKVADITAEDGSTSAEPISFDYRISNSCNFKCQMCGPDASSTWENFLKQAKLFDYQANPWSQPANKAVISQFRGQIAKTELLKAIDSGRLREIYWVGGEPLSWSFHWDVMKEIISTGLSQKAFFRYNTNLSLLSYNGQSFHGDILEKLNNYKISASIDGIGPVGEWIRDGFESKTYIRNYQIIQSVTGRSDSIVMDVTMTLPGLFSLKELIDLAIELNTGVYLKMILSPNPEIVLSPLALPRKILDRIWRELITYAEEKVKSHPKIKTLLSTLYMFSQKANFEELYPLEYRSAFFAGREKLLRNLSAQKKLRTRPLIALDEIYSLNSDVFDWWTQNEAGGKNE